MANKKSSQKRIRQNIVHKERNRTARTAVRTTVKKARAAVEAGEKTAANLVKDAVRALAKAGARGHMHKKAAARKMSRLAKLARAKAGASK